MTFFALLLATGDGVPLILFPIAMVCDTAIIVTAMIMFH